MISVYIFGNFDVSVMKESQEKKKEKKKIAKEEKSGWIMKILLPEKAKS